MANTFKSDTKTNVVTDAVSSTNTNVVTCGGSATIVLLSGSKVIMEANDILRVRAGTASALDVTVSYLEQT